jgi:hypothetical protein
VSLGQREAFRPDLTGRIRKARKEEGSVFLPWGESTWTHATCVYIGSYRSIEQPPADQQDIGFVKHSQRFLNRPQFKI